MSELEKEEGKQWPPEEGWKKYRQSRRREWDWFERLLHSFCAQIKGPDRNDGPGRNPLPHRDEVFCTVMKMYINKSSDLVFPALKNCAKRKLIAKAPHPNSISNFLDDEKTTDLLLPLIPQMAMSMMMASTSLGAGVLLNGDGQGKTHYRRPPWRG